MTDERSGDRARDTLATAVRWLLWANVAGSAIEIAFRWTRGFDPDLIGQAEWASVLVQLFLFVVTGIAFLVWLYRAKAKARALGAEDMMVSPGWAAGWFFVPLANLVMPFIAMRELWQASAQPRDWQLAPSSPAIPVWWAFWLGTTISGNAAFVLGRQEDWDMIVAADFMGMISAILTVPAALALAWIVGRIQTMQDSSAHLAARFA